MNVEKLIEILSGCNPEAEVIIRDELRIMQTTNGYQAKEGIYDDFRVLQWYINKEGDPEGVRDIFVSFSFINEERARKVISSN